MHKSQVEQEEGPIFLPGSKDPSSLSAALAGTVIQFPFQSPVAAASMALEDASSSDWDVPPTIGELAVRLVADWSLPRLVVMTIKREEET